MKHFAIGDEHKRITCPNRYLADWEGDNTTILWDPEREDFPIRVSIITVTPKNKNEDDFAFWSVIEKAKEGGVQPIVDGNKAIHATREPSEGEDGFLHFRYIGIGNHLCIFSLFSDAAEESSPQFVQVKSDMEEMIATLKLRESDEQFSCCPYQSDFETIDEIVESLTPLGNGQLDWQNLQSQLDRAWQSSDEDLAGKVGIAFGSLLMRELPSLTWSVKVDQWGRSLSLDLEKTSISIFPRDMILKRFDERERVDLRQLAQDTIDTLEEIFRKHHEREAE